MLPPPELLSPAGDWDALRAAVANGADAVYFGLDHFNARHRAKNFTREELPRVMDYLHARNVKGFVTFNTLIFSDELSEAVDYLTELANAGVDAVLVQDLGVAHLLHRLAPSLPIHGSTQMTLTDPRGIEFVRTLGVQRVVLARELSLRDIARIRPETTLELEVFVHGALCVAYSGQCLTSESLGGRSANRGQCAQACRLPYQLIVDGAPRDLGDKQYLLSPSDLAAHDLIHDLTQLGVSCFKIEGRLKSAHYVAATTQTYRAAIDAAARGVKFAISPQQRLDLEQSFSRGFTHGFLGGVNHQELVSARFSKARGTRIGTVERVTPRSITLRVDAAKQNRDRKGATAEPIPLKPGDGVVFDEGHPEQDEQGGRVFAVRTPAPGLLEIELGHGDINRAYINPGALVWKTDDPHINKRLEHSFARETIARRVPLTFHIDAHAGGHLQLRAAAEGHETAATYAEKSLEPARKHPFTEAAARTQLGRLGDTPYALAGITCDIRGNPMVPASVLNDLRRQCVESLLRQRTCAHVIVEPNVLEHLRQAIQEKFPPAPPGPPQLTVLIRTMEQLDAVLPARPAMLYADFEDVRRYPDAVQRCRAAGIPIALATLRIVKPGEDGLLQQIAAARPDAVLVRNLSALSYYLQHHQALAILGDYSLNVSNELTASLLLQQGLRRLVPSYDLNFQQLTAMLARIDPRLCEVVLHQHMPMFHVEHCVFAHTLSKGKDFHDCGRPCERHRVDLADRVGQPHPLIPDVGCRNTVFNAQAQTAAEFVPELRRLGVEFFRVELLRENAAEAAALVGKYGELLAGRTPARAMVRSLRVLNQLGVTPGTLVHE